MRSLPTSFRSLCDCLLFLLISPLLLSATASSPATPTILEPVIHGGRSTAAFDCSTVTEIPQIECEALVTLYNSTNGPGWVNRAGWLSNSTPCSWYGVACANGHVSALWLHYPGSVTTPPGSESPSPTDRDRSASTWRSGGDVSSLGNPDYLVWRNIVENSPGNWFGVRFAAKSELYAGNGLVGTIPPELGNLSGLTRLALHGNQLSGGVPSQLGNLTNLTWLCLYDTPLSGALPASLTKLHLQTFTFHRTGLCEPGDAAFQSWLASIPSLGRTGVICPVSPTPSRTATTTPTTTASTTPTSTSTSTNTATRTHTATRTCTRVPAPPRTPTPTRPVTYRYLMYLGRIAPATPTMLEPIVHGRHPNAATATILPRDGWR
jgi:hypothetical protein